MKVLERNSPHLAVPEGATLWSENLNSERSEKSIAKMGFMCDFCGDQRSMVYCRSDAACLCLSCDRNVHSANALSRRHTRTLLCERCHLQPSTVRCIEERVSLCQNCDWTGHGTSTLASSSHKRQTINCYSGCPSAAELSCIWSFVLDVPSVNDACEKELGLMSIAETDLTGAWSLSENNAGQRMPRSTEASDVCSREKSNVLVGSSSLFGSRPHTSDQSVELDNVALPKVNDNFLVLDFVAKFLTKYGNI